MAAPRFNFRAEDVVAKGRVSREGIEELKEWLKGEDYPELTEEQLVVFLLSCGCELEATQKTIRAHYRSKLNVPEFFDERDVDREELQAQIRVSDFAILPVRTPSGAAITYFRLRKFHYSFYHFVPCIKFWLMLLESLIHDDPPTGLVIIVDMEALGLMHLTRLRMGPLKNYIYFLQEGLPLMLKEIHVLNSIYVVDKLMTLVKPFMSKELLNLVKFYPRGMDVREFHKAIPPDCLPECLGGTLTSVETLAEETVQKMRELKPFFEAEEKQRERFKAKQRSK